MVELQLVFDETIKRYKQQLEAATREGRDSRQIEERLALTYDVACDMEFIAKILGLVQREGSMPEDLPRYEVARIVEACRAITHRNMELAAEGKLRKSSGSDGEESISSPCVMCPVQEFCDFEPTDERCLHNCSIRPPDAVAASTLPQPRQSSSAEPRPKAKTAKSQPRDNVIQTHLDFDPRDRDKDVY